LCYVIDSGLSTSLLLLATLIIMFYITLHLQGDRNVVMLAYNDFTFLLIFGFSPNLGLSDSLNKRQGLANHCPSVL